MASIALSSFAGFDPTGITSSDGAMALALAAIPASSGGGTITIGGADKIRLDTTIALQQGQRIIGEFDARYHAGSGYGSAFDQCGSAIRLHGGAEIRIDNGGVLRNVLAYRDGLQFDVAQDFNTWTGVGVRLGYGNDQRVEEVMILGFDTCLKNINDRGLNGNGRVILDKVYVDGRNGIKLIGSYDTCFIDRIRAFCFVTQGYAGTPAAGETYDPRKDRRPGVGFQMLDRSDGTMIGRIETFAYQTGIDISTASWIASELFTDYPSTPTYPTPSGVVGVSLRKSVDTSSGYSRPVDCDPSNIGSLQVWGADRGLTYSGDTGRIGVINAAAFVGLSGDAVTVDGGGLDIGLLEVSSCSGIPVTFASAPNTVTRIRGHAKLFGPQRNSWNAPVVRSPTGSNTHLIDVRLATDQAAGSRYFDDSTGFGIPKFPSLASANPIMLPPPYGDKGVETFLITGSASLAGIYGAPGARQIRFIFQSALTVYGAAYAGAIRLPSGAASMPVTAGAIMTLDYNGSTDRWNVVSYVA